MLERKQIIAGLIAAGLSIMLAGASVAATITPIYDANMTQAQKDIVQQKINLWQPRLAKNISITIDFANADLGAAQFGLVGRARPWMEPFIAHLPSGEDLALAETDQFQQDPNGKPTHARIRFNSNAAVSWHYGGTPVPGDKYDFWTVVNHELVHALGFTVNYTRFGAAITPGPGDKRTFSCGGTTATLTPSDEGTHLDPTAHPGDLMNPTINMGERRTPSTLVINMLTCIWPLFFSYPALGTWGLIVLVVAIVAVALWAMRRRTTAGVTPRT